MWHPDTPTEYRNAIVTGDARVLSERIPDESVDLIFTDPVYERMEDYRWLSETAQRILKPDSALLAYCGIGYVPQTHQALLAGGLSYRWRLITKFYSPEFAGRLLIKTQECLWYEKGKTRLYQAIFDCEDSSTTGMYRVGAANWGKGLDIVVRYICTFTKPGDVVCDPFAGRGTVYAACKMLGREYVGFEINPTVATDARMRVLLTQPPLFVQEPEQAALGI